METVEILAGAEFANAIHELNLTSAKCTYHYQPKPGSCRVDYQVWLMTKADFDSLCTIDDEAWKEDWGWWRYATGSNCGSVNREFVIHGERILAWDGCQRKEAYNECLQCGDYYKNCVDGKVLSRPCYATDGEITQCLGAREYPDIISYLCEEIGASTEKNVCACTIDLALQNKMGLSELFKKYLGGD